MQIRKSLAVYKPNSNHLCFFERSDSLQDNIPIATDSSFFLYAVFILRISICNIQSTSLYSSLFFSAANSDRKCSKNICMNNYPFCPGCICGTVWEVVDWLTCRQPCITAVLLLMWVI